MTAARVAVIGNYRPDGQESMQRFGAMLAAMLAAPDVTVRLFTPTVRVGRLASRRAGVAKWLGYVDKFLLFPLEVRRLAARHDAVVIGDHSNALYARVTGATPTLLVCHDLLAVRAAAGEFDRHRPGPTGRWLQAIIRSSMRHADHIVCVSDATCRDVCRLIGDDVPTTVIGNPLQDDYRSTPPSDVDARLGRLGLGGRRYFLHVGGNQWYKNRVGVVGLFEALVRQPAFDAHRLVLAGKAPTAEVSDAIERSGLGGRIDIVEAPANADLNMLYAGAEALLFPSLHEGFGWPIIEAQAAGCVVITSDRLPMRDVAGAGGAILVDPDQPDAAAAAIAAARPKFDTFRDAGRRNVSRFGKDEAADRYRRLIRSLLPLAARNGMSVCASLERAGR